MCRAFTAGNVIPFIKGPLQRAAIKSYICQMETLLLQTPAPGCFPFDYQEWGMFLATLLTGIWFAILFIQSGLDKFTDWQGNLSWLTGHFGKSPLRGMVPQMLMTVAIAETLGGLACAAGAAYFAFSFNSCILFWGFVLCLLDLVMLFFGQRLAKDYVGAASLQPYFLVGLAGLLLSMSMAK